MRRTIRFLAPLLLLLALPLSGATVAIDPPNPTSATPVKLFVREWVSCPPPPQLVRSATTIYVMIDPGPCLSPPVLGTFEFSLGTLPPGDYEVIVNPAARSGYGMFYVRDAAPQVFALGQSVGPTTGGTEVILDAPDAGLCFGPDLSVCPIPPVSFNGVPAAVDVEKFRSGMLAVTAPPNRKGIAEVVVTGPRGARRGRVFRYYDPNGAPPMTMFERVLVPVYTFGPGAFGSNWTTEVWSFNARNFDIEPYRRAPAVLAQRASTPLDFGRSRTGGVLFFPPLDSSSLQFGSLVRDLSRQSEDWGTEVPIVRDNEFRTSTFSLLNIPIDARFRQTLRIYDIDSVEEFVTLEVYSMESGERLGDPTGVALRSALPCGRFEPCASDEPAMATVDLGTLFPGLPPGERVRIDIYPPSDARLWAFATITNNQTQHVTVITPQ